MNILDQYTIQYSGLSLGNHSFDFQVDGAFFDAIESSVVKNGTVTVHLLLEKTSQLMNLHFHLQGSIEVNCDRCAISWPYPLDIQTRLLVRFADLTENVDDPDIVYISRNDFQFNVAQYIYEYVVTALPLHIIPCEITDNLTLCDQEALQRLNSMQPASSLHTDNADPRWDALKQLENKFTKDN